MPPHKKKNKRRKRRRKEDKEREEKSIKLNALAAGRLSSLKTIAKKINREGEKNERKIKKKKRRNKKIGFGKALRSVSHKIGKNIEKRNKTLDKAFKEAGKDIAKTAKKTAKGLTEGVTFAIDHTETIGRITSLSGDILITIGTLTGQPEIVAVGAGVKEAGDLVETAGRKAKSARTAVEKTKALAESIRKKKGLAENLSNVSGILHGVADATDNTELLKLAALLALGANHTSVAAEHIADIKRSHGIGDIGGILRGLGGITTEIDNALIGLVEIQEEREERMLNVLEKLAESHLINIDAETGLVLDRSPFIPGGPIGIDETDTDDDDDDDLDLTGITPPKSGAVSPQEIDLLPDLPSLPKFDNETERKLQEEEKAEKEEKESDINAIKLRDEGIARTQELIKQTFRKFISKNIGLQLDDAILMIENAKEKTLKEFAKKKGRTAKSYRDIYREKYNQAKTEIINEQRDKIIKQRELREEAKLLREKNRKQENIIATGLTDEDVDTLEDTIVKSVKRKKRSKEFVKLNQEELLQLAKLRKPQLIALAKRLKIRRGGTKEELLKRIINVQEGTHVKKVRPPSNYNKFIGAQLRKGLSFKESVALWNKSKK